MVQPRLRSAEPADRGRGLGDPLRELLATIAVEPEQRLRGLADEAAGSAATAITVLPWRADRRPLPDHSVDAAVLCLVLCSVDDRPAALAEVVRVLRPGGRLRFLEHTLAGPWLPRHPHVLGSAPVR